MRRIRWIDVVRGLGITCIVLSHVLQDVGLVSKFLYSFHVPLFFFVSGILYSDKDVSFVAVIKKKTQRILLPWFIWGIISLFLFLLLGNIAESVLKSGRQTTLSKGILELLYGYSEGNTPLWFLPAMYVTSLLMWCFVRLEKSIKCINAKYLFAAAPIFLSIASAYVLRYYGVDYALWSIDDVAVLFCFTWTGYLLKNRLPKINILIGLVAVSIACGLAINCNGFIKYLKAEYHSLAMFYISASLSIVGICSIAQTINKCSILEYIGRNTLPILLMHKFPVLFFQCVCPFVKDRWAVRSFVSMLLITALSIALCCLVGEVLRKVFPSIIGERRRMR